MSDTRLFVADSQRGMSVDRTKRDALLVLASTYPRWQGDPEPAFVHELAKRLAVCFDVTVVAPHAPGAVSREMLDGVRVRRYRYAPARWETLVNDGGMLANLRRARWKWLLLPGFLFAQWLAVRRAVRELGPCAVHAHWLLPQGLIALLAVRGVPVLLTAHGADLFGLRSRVFAHLRGWVVRRAAMTGVVSQAMRSRLLEEAPQARVRVLPMGVDDEQLFRPDDTPREKDALLFVGRLVEKKGLHHLVEAMPAVLASRPQAVLTVAGFGPEQARLELRATELGIREHIRFLGAQPQASLPDLYRRASLLVAPFVEARGGDQEGLGLVVAEAMACGCPVLVGDVAGVRDLVDGRTGALVDASDHRALAATVSSLLADETRRRQLGEMGREHVQRRYSWRVVADGYIRSISALANGRES
jgi:glycosyltransferase involved in cell wall biosynthesis